MSTSRSDIGAGRGNPTHKKTVLPVTATGTAQPNVKDTPILSTSLNNVQCINLILWSCCFFFFCVSVALAIAFPIAYLNQ